jgi:uncharacterized Tic20 family protein
MIEVFVLLFAFVIGLASVAGAIAAWILKRRSKRPVNDE